LVRQRDFQSLLQLYFGPPALTIAQKTQTIAIFFLSSCKKLLYCCCCFYLVFCFPVARNFGDPRVSGVRVRGSRCCWALFRCFFWFVFSMCVCVCSCLLCVYVFLCFIQVKALVVAFLAEFSFVCV
jgi:hypothetical protein